MVTIIALTQFNGRVPEMLIRRQSKELRKSNVRPSMLMLIMGMFFVACAVPNVPRVLAHSTARDSAIQAQPGRSQLTGPYLTWLNEDVRWIITAKEQSACMALQSNQEWQQFIKEFWQRRNPDPDSPDNRFKEEHYRRLAYANTHFAATHPGWMTDRGRIYIIYGEPDSIDAHPFHEKGETSPFEIWHNGFEIWHYRTLHDVKFVDTCRCGDYKLDSPPGL